MSTSPAPAASSSRITADGLDTEGRRWGRDSMSTEWTDEKHNLYLSSMEESFINQLYNSEYGPIDSFGRLLRSQKQLKSIGCYAKKLSSCQFKVLRDNQWKKFNFEVIHRADMKNEIHDLTSNQWIQHFRPRNISKEKQLILKQVDGNELYCPTFHSESQNHRRKVTSTKQVQAFYSHICHQDSIGSSAEVSDQNFVDVDVQGGEQRNRACRQKRPRAEDDGSQVKE